MFKKWMDMKSRCLDLETALESAEQTLRDEEGRTPEPENLKVQDQLEECKEEEPSV